MPAVLGNIERSEDWIDRLRWAIDMPPRDCIPSGKRHVRLLHNQSVVAGHEVEVVSASQLHGAVSALHAALDASESYPDDEQGRGEALMALQSAVRRVLAVL